MTRDRFEKWGVRNSKMKRKLRNPYFTKRGFLPRGRVHGLRGLLAGLGVALGGAILIILPVEAWTQPYFTLKNINYETAELLPAREQTVRSAVEAALDEKFIFGISRRNYFLAPVAIIKKNIEAGGPYAQIKIKKKFPDGLLIAVQQPERVFLVTDRGERSFADGDGVVLDKLEAATSSANMLNLPIFIATSTLINVTIERSPSSTVSIGPGQEIIPKNCATLIKALHNGLNRLGVSPSRYTAKEDGTNVVGFTKDGWRLIADPIISATDQLERLAAVLRDPRYKDRAKYDYIDVRYPDKVYVKQK